MEKAGQRLPISAGSKSVESASDSRPEISRAALRSLPWSDVVSTQCYQVETWIVLSLRTRSTLYPRLPHCASNLHGLHCLLYSSTPARWFLKLFASIICHLNLDVAPLVCRSVLLVPVLVVSCNCYLLSSYRVWLGNSQGTWFRSWQNVLSPFLLQLLALRFLGLCCCE